MAVNLLDLTSEQREGFASTLLTLSDDPKEAQFGDGPLQTHLQTHFNHLWFVFVRVREKATSQQITDAISDFFDEEPPPLTDTE